MLPFVPFIAEGESAVVYDYDHNEKVVPQLEGGMRAELLRK